VVFNYAQDTSSCSFNSTQLEYWLNWLKFIAIFLKLQNVVIIQLNTKRSPHF